MAEKYQNKYRSKSARLENWNYGWNAEYFVTINTHNRIHFFGEIYNNKMDLSDVGKLAEQYWFEIPKYFPYIKLGAHVVMPNHVHGIIIIDKPYNYFETKNNEPMGENKIIDSGISHMGRDEINRVPTHVGYTHPNGNSETPPPSQKTKGGITQHNNPMLYDNLSRVVRWFKGRVTFESRKIDIKFCWQARFYDHIIRNDKAFYNISKYIINNPKNWERDRFRKRK